MPKNFNELKERVLADPEGRAAVEEYGRAIDDALALADLRKGVEMTQSDVGKVLGVTQVNVSRIEHTNDLYVSTLRGYVEALGGELELRAVFPEREVALDVAAWPIKASSFSQTGQVSRAVGGTEEGQPRARRARGQ